VIKVKSLARFCVPVSVLVCLEFFSGYTQIFTRGIFIRNTPKTVL